MFITSTAKHTELAQGNKASYSAFKLPLKFFFFVVSPNKNYPFFVER
jgi:hypothetical protein